MVLTKKIRSESLKYFFYIMMRNLIETINIKQMFELKKNLISLGYLEKQGYAFSSQSGSRNLKITKGALVVMRGRRLSNNLYRMEGSVMIDNVKKPAVA